MVMQAAMDYRKTFHKDVVVDVVCYRKNGHNESDDPTLTQPMMYKAVAKHPGTRALYAEKLVQEGVVSQEQTDSYVQAYRDALDRGEHVEQTRLSDYTSKHSVDWTKYQGKDWREAVESGLSAEDIKRLADKFTYVPEGVRLAQHLQTAGGEPQSNGGRRTEYRLGHGGDHRLCQHGNKRHRRTYFRRRFRSWYFLTSSGCTA